MQNKIHPTSAIKAGEGCMSQPLRTEGVNTLNRLTLLSKKARQKKSLRTLLKIQKIRNLFLEKHLRYTSDSARFLSWNLMLIRCLLHEKNSDKEKLEDIKKICNSVLQLCSESGEIKYECRCYKCLAKKEKIILDIRNHLRNYI